MQNFKNSTQQTKRTSSMKLYIIRKYVVANSAAEAIVKERRQTVDDVWLDDDWKKSQTGNSLTIGFSSKAKK